MPIPCETGIGGLSEGSILELSGAPGEGKTRTCISFAMNMCLQDDEKEQSPRVLMIGK